MVAPFLKQYPQIELQIVVESSLIDIVEKGFDAGVRYGERLAQDMIAVPLADPNVTPWSHRRTLLPAMVDRRSQGTC